MKKSYFLFAIFIGTFLFSQTKLIAYKSHSGNMNRFETSVSKNIFDANESNLGGPPLNVITVDSVILLNNDKAVIVSNFKKYGNGIGIKSRDTISLKSSKKTFSKNAVDSLLDKKYYRNLILQDSTVFLKYNKRKNTYKKVEFSKPKPQIKKSEIKKESLMKNGLIILVFIISGFAALHSWRKNRRHES